MPELPEVETTRRGITAHITGQKIERVQLRETRLRWPITKQFGNQLALQTIINVTRRAKYLLFELPNGFFMLHLGMSGSLRITEQNEPLRKHDHIVIVFANKKSLRFNDPRRFGCALWLGKDPYQHSLLKFLGPEPFDESFNADYLFLRAKKRKAAIKNFIMDNKIVVGVGNIYANEALFMSGIRPRKAAGRITRQQFAILVDNIKKVLEQSISMGGSTLRDFVGGDGKPGYFQQTLRVYGRAGEPCIHCETSIKQIIIGQRSSFYCPACQH